MKKSFSILLLVLGFTVLLTSCTKDDDFEGAAQLKSGSTNSVQEWIYDMMSEWYLWNDDIRSKDPNFVLNYERFFYSLLSNDKGDGKAGEYYYSYIERYPVGTRSQTLEMGFGFEFGMVVRQHDTYTKGVPDQRVYAMVTYVYEGSPAWNAGLRRGHCIGRINDANMNLSNYETLYPLLLEERVTGKAVVPVKISWFDLRDSGEVYTASGQTFNLSSVSLAGEATLTPTNIEHDPIHKYEVITTDSGKKVAYLMYNSFEKGDRATYNDALKRVFSYFQSQGVDELVLDLRYNGGGYVTTAQLLSSMIVPASKQGTAYENLRFNNNVVNSYGRDYNVVLNFLSESEMVGDEFGKTAAGVTLGMSKVYVIGTDLTASSSESVINNLRGADIEVVHIGTITEGKNVGMQKIGPETGFGGVFDGYVHNIWPVSFYCYNSKGESDFRNGFYPNIWHDEYDNIEWFELGDPQEALLSLAIEHIENGSVSVRGAASSAIGTTSLVSSAKFRPRRAALWENNN